MTAKAFALICVLLIAATCFQSTDGWRRRRRSPPPPPKIVCSYRLFCVSAPIPRCFIHRICVLLSGKKRSVEDNFVKECLPARTQSYDCNNDGKVSYREFAVALLLDEEMSSSHEAFRRGDADGDGFLTAQELRNHPMTVEDPDCLQNQRRQRTDLDGILPGNFDVYDTDGNGKIDWTEFGEQLSKTEARNTSLRAFRQLMERIARCDGTIDRDDFDMAVAVTTSWLFKRGEGQEGEDQMALEAKVDKEERDEAVTVGPTVQVADADTKQDEADEGNERDERDSGIDHDDEFDDDGQFEDDENDKTVGEEDEDDDVSDKD